MHEATFLLLFAVATAVAIGARWLKIPYTVALVVAGLILGATHAIETPHLTKELLFAVILPGLIFEAAFHLDAKKFWADRFAVASLAIPGLLVAVLLTAALLAPVADAIEPNVGFELTHALVFAALIVATDPIAVVGLFKSLGAPKRLAVLVEGESLINDGTGVVVFGLVVAGVTSGHLSAGEAVIDFVRVAGLGALIGAAFGYGASQIIVRIDDPMVELTLTIVAGYGSFTLAEQFHVSGVMACVLAGMLCGNYGRRVGMSPTTRIAVETAWEYIAFALNSIVFLLIGMEVQLEGLLAAWKAILVGFFAVLVARAVVVFVVSAALSRTKKRIPWAWSAVLTWSGLRGALSMVLVLGLPSDFPHRTLLVNMTFGVVVLSILLQGLSMGPLLRVLGVSTRRSPEQERHERELGILQAVQAGLGEIAHMKHERAAGAGILELLQREYEERAKHAETAIGGLHLEAAELREEELRAARRRLLIAERDAIVNAANRGVVGHDVLSALLADVDSRLQVLEDAPAEAEPARARDSRGAPAPRESVPPPESAKKHVEPAETAKPAEREPPSGGRGG